MCHSFGQIWDFSQCPLYSDTKWLSTGDSFQEDGGSRHRNDWLSASDLVALSRRNTQEELIKLRKLRPEIIVDDASHLWSHQVKALLLLWEALPHGGMYILEDIGTAFPNLAGRGGFDDAIVSGYDFCSAVAECVTSGEHLRMVDRTAGQAIFAREIERIAMEVDMITFINGSCLMIKA